MNALMRRVDASAALRCSDEMSDGRVTVRYNGLSFVVIAPKEDDEAAVKRLFDFDVQLKRVMETATHIGWQADKVPPPAPLPAQLIPQHTPSVVPNPQPVALPMTGGQPFESMPDNWLRNWVLRCAAAPYECLGLEKFAQTTVVRARYECLYARLHTYPDVVQAINSAYTRAVQINMRRAAMGL